MMAGGSRAESWPPDGWADRDLAAQIVAALDADSTLVVRADCYNRREMEATKELIPERLRARCLWRWWGFDERAERIENDRRRA